MATAESQTPLPGWSDPRLYLRAYGCAEAARLVRVSERTIGRWYRGDEAPGHPMRPVLPAAGPTLSYLQLIELAFIADFRRLGVDLDRLRQAHAYLRATFRVDHPFAQIEFRTDGVHVLARLTDPRAPDGHEHLIAADAVGQMVWPETVVQRFAQLEYERGTVRRWFPRGRSVPIALDPRVAFGAPILLPSGVPTRAIDERGRAGASVAEIARDLAISAELVALALRFERAAADR